MLTRLAHEVPLAPDDLAKLQRIYTDILREQPDHVRALDKEALAAQLIKLFQMGHTEEGELRRLVVGVPAHIRETIAPKASR